VVNKTEIMQHILKCGKFPSYQIIQKKILGEFFYADLNFIPSETPLILHLADRLQPGRSSYSPSVPPTCKKPMSEITINLIYKTSRHSYVWAFYVRTQIARCLFHQNENLKKRWFRKFEIKIRVCNKNLLVPLLITRNVSQYLEQYYRAKMKKQYRIVENKLVHNVY
jgi:hypothetical protein